MLYLESIFILRFRKCKWERKDKEYKLNLFVFIKIGFYLDVGNFGSGVFFFVVLIDLVYSYWVFFDLVGCLSSWLFK